MEMVTLRNGQQEAKALVVATMMNLKQLTGDIPGWLQLADLVEACKSNDVYRGGGNAQDLVKRGLLQGDGKVHGSIRNIVLSSIHGDGPDMEVGSPIAKGE